MVDVDVRLTPEEARVAGCLVEKSFTTPDAYPLSLNAVVTACNQTTNRDPVVHYDPGTVDRALDGLRAAGLARRIKSSGQRVIKHRHALDEALGLDPAGVALLGLLLLRGAQTPGELKGRAERLHGFATPAAVEDALGRLAARGLAARLERKPGQKEHRWVQLLAPVGGPGDAAAAAAVPAAAGDGEPEGLAAAARAGRAFAVRNPATGETIRTLEADGEDEIAARLGRARRAQPEWAARPYGERAAALRRFCDLLTADAGECAALLTAEVGKPIRQARNEIAAVPERVAWFVEHTGALLDPRTVTEDEQWTERVTSEPVGVVAHVSAWNYPYFVGLTTIAPALLTGSAVLYKPSELATLTGLRIVDLLHGAGVPLDVVQAVVGEGATGAALVESDVDMVCFTGSHATGSKVARTAAERLTRVQLELGGKDPAYVCDDVDVDSAAAAVAEGAFYNGGQSCCAVERVYVHERIWQPFVDAFVRVVDGYRTGDPADDATDLGPLARAEQPALLEAQVADAVARGAEVRTGGGRLPGPGHWFAPTVLVGADHRMRVMREESFGPVIGLQRVAGDDEAGALMGDTEYGLTAAVFSADRARAERVLAGLDVGSAYWNCSDRTTARLPWAGRRHSGLGVSMSESGIRALLRERAWHLRASC